MIDLINQFTIENGAMRDYLFLLRFLTIIVTGYLVILMARRIREAGKLSATTGLTLYLIGFGMHQFSITNLIFYYGWDMNPIIYTFTSAVYLVVMAMYAFFSEYDQKKHPMKETRKKFAFPWTIFSAIGLIIWFGIGFINYNLLSTGFAYMVIPFIATTSRFMDRFKDLEMLKANQPWRWFFIGLGISGMSNFLFSMVFDIVIIIIIQATLVITGVLFMTKGWNAVPALSESDWYMNMNRLLIVQRVGSLVLYSYAFQSSRKTNSKEAETDDNLTGGALSGIQSLLGEILASEQTINEIDHGDKTIYFKHGDHVSVILITYGKAREYHIRLRNFVTAFETQFEKELVNFAGNITGFYKTDQLVKTYFMRQVK